MERKDILNSYIKKSGKTKVFLADKMGVCRPTFYRVCDNPISATFQQATFLKDELEIPTQDMKLIFLP